MPETRYFLPAPETVTLSAQTVDALIRSGDGDAALLYLYMLKANGQYSQEGASAATGIPPGRVDEAARILLKLGLLADEPGRPAASPVGAADADTADAGAVAADAADAADARAGRVAAAAREVQVRAYTVEEITAAASANRDFSSLIDETNSSLGKFLSPDELVRLYGIYDDLGLPVEVILQLVTHCINETSSRGSGRKPSMRYIEKAAYTWEREGINSLERAEEYLKSLEARKTLRGEIKRALQITNRELSPSEQRYVDSWIELGYGADAVAVAYDRTVLKTGDRSWRYMDSIIKNWHKKGLFTVQAIEEQDTRNEADGNGKAKKGAAGFGAPDTDDIERMKRLLEKVKSD